MGKEEAVCVLCMWCGVGGVELDGEGHGMGVGWVGERGETYGCFSMRFSRREGAYDML